MVRARTLTVVAGVLLAEAFLLYRAFHYGPMAGLLPWDDCMVVLRSLHNLRMFASTASLAELFPLAWSLVIHSPLSDIQTLLGLMIGGGATIAPYLLNALFVIPAFWAVLVRTGRLPWALFAALMLALLAQPVTLGALTFLKSDWKGGLLVAAAMPLLYQGVAEERRALKFWGAGLLGVGVAAKLTTLYMPVIAIFILLGFEVVGLIARPPGRGELEPRLQAVRADLSPMAGLVFIPYIVFLLQSALGQHNILAYIRYALGDTWNDGLTHTERALFYSPLAAGGGAWGHLHWIVLAFAAGALPLSLRARDRLYPAALVLLLGTAAVLYAPLVAARTSNWEFGAGMLGVVIGLALISIRVFAERAPRWGGAAALAGVVLLSLTAPLKAPFQMPDVRPATQAELQAIEKSYDAIGEALLARAPVPEPKVRVLFEHTYAPFPDLSLGFFRRTGRLIDVDRIDDLSRAEGVQDLLSSDFALTAVPTGPRPIWALSPRYPTTRDPAGADAFVQARPEFFLIGRYPIPDGEVRLYQRRPRPAAPGSD
jgi:hypothetical protein